MSAIPFIKMHGAGNDYVFIDGFENGLPSDPQSLARQVSPRHTAIGSDGLVYIERPSLSDSQSADGADDVDAVMRMWNADGSAGAMCGNAVRCVALWLHREGRVGQQCRIRVGRRVVLAEVIDMAQNHCNGVVRVNMGQAELGEPAKQTVPGLSYPGGQPVEVTVVSMGNPHAVVFVDQLSDGLLTTLGPAIETHSMFRDRTNVEFVRSDAGNQFTVRVWERGSGETLACGSGACAVAAAARHLGLCDAGQPVTIRMPGGELQIDWNSSGEVLMEGPVELSYMGIWPDHAT
jgi:diaminopimelate epimerase